MTQQNNQEHLEAMLHDLSALVSQPFESVQNCLSVMLPVIMRHLDVQAAFVSQFTPYNLQFISAMDTSGCGLMNAEREPLLESFCQYVYATGVPVVIADAATDPRVQETGLRTKFSIGSYVGVPIIRSSGTIYGTLCALDPEKRMYIPAQVAFLSVLASKIAWLIEQVPHTRMLDHSLEPADSNALPSTDPTIMVRMLAHDIRSPLTSIIGYCKMLVEGIVGGLNDEQQSMIASIDHSSRFIHRLATDMVASVERHQATLSLLIDYYDPIQVIQQLSTVYQGQAHRKGLAFHVLIDTPPIPCVGDAMRVQHVLSNLLTNAIKYTETGYVSLRVGAWQQGVEYMVSDSGCGIASDEQERVWNLYARGNHDRPGFGIGLYVVQQLVTAMSGTIDLVSASGQGSTFTVRLPLSIQRPASITMFAH